MQAENTSPTLDDFEKDFFEITCGMSAVNIDAIRKGLPLEEKDNTSEVTEARRVWQKLQTCRKHTR